MQAEGVDAEHVARASFEVRRLGDIDFARHMRARNVDRGAIPGGDGGPADEERDACEGVLVTTPVFLGFLSAAHSNDDIDHIITAHRAALAEMKRRGFID